MICPVCGYTDTQSGAVAVHCPNCGTPYNQRAASDTQFPTPYSVDPTLPEASPYDTADMAGYTVPAPPPLPAIGPTPPRAIPSAPRPPAGSTGGRNRRQMLIIGAAVVVAVVLVGGVIFALVARGGATAASTTTPAASATATPVRAAPLLYTDPNHQFTVKYPATWTATPTTASIDGVSINVTTFSAPTGHRAYLVAVASAPLAFSDVPPLLAPSQVTDFMPGTPSTVTIKQRQWQMVSGKATVAGKPGAVFALLWRKSNTSYLLIAYGAGAKYLTNGAKPFEQFARSFTPGSGA